MVGVFGAKEGMAERRVDPHDGPQPPKAFAKPMNDVFSRAAKNFKKVTWPPTPEPPPKEVEPPPENVALLDALPINSEAMFQQNENYHLVPTVYAEDPDNFNDDVWPPPVPPDLSERVVYDETRPGRVIRDFEVLVPLDATPVHKSYKIAPGTLHVFSDRLGALGFDTTDIGGAKMAAPPTNN